MRLAVWPFVLLRVPLLGARLLLVGVAWLGLAGKVAPRMVHARELGHRIPASRILGQLAGYFLFGFEFFGQGSQSLFVLDF